MLGLNKGRNDLGKDEFLLCCSYPLTKEIFIEII
jgi:ring-1,2-phenylacetyl-CoA epoxidase subunit PaaE